MMNTVVVCEDCELPYQDHGLDITLPNDQWESIHPEIAGVLCGRCIAVRASQLPGAIAIRAYIDFGEIVERCRENTLDISDRRVF